jgi:hypothetical protein
LLNGLPKRYFYILNPKAVIDRLSRADTHHDWHILDAIFWYRQKRELVKGMLAIVEASELIVFGFAHRLPFVLPTSLVIEEVNIDIAR